MNRRALIVFVLLNIAISVGVALLVIYFWQQWQAEPLDDAVVQVFEVVILKTIRFAEASVASQAILDYARSHRGAEEYVQMAEVLVHVKTPAHEPA